MATGKPKPKHLGIKPQYLCVPPHQTQTGRRGHQQRHHEMPHAHMAQQTRNSPKSPTANRRHHEMGNRGGFLGVGSQRGHSRRIRQKQHPTQPHASPAPQQSRRCHRNRRIVKRSLGNHRRVQDPYSDSNQKRRSPKRHMGRDRRSPRTHGRFPANEPRPVARIGCL